MSWLSRWFQLRRRRLTMFGVGLCGDLCLVDVRFAVADFERLLKNGFNRVRGSSHF